MSDPRHTSAITAYNIFLPGTTISLQPLLPIAATHSRNKKQELKRMLAMGVTDQSCDFPHMMVVTCHGTIFHFENVCTFRPVALRLWLSP